MNTSYLYNAQRSEGREEQKETEKERTERETHNILKQN
jgi:hypothetical protein